MSTLKLVMLYLLGIGFIVTGTLHFLKPEMYLRIMPPYLPWPMFLQYLAGFFEILFGVMVLIPKTRRLGAWGLVLLLIAVYPANIHMALHQDQYPEVGVWFHRIRIPLQIPLIAWAWWFTRGG